MDGQFVAYYRTSTKRQDLGIEAQKAAVAQFLNGGQWELIGEFEEKESGKRDDNRLALQAALALCKKRKATLVIAKLDRLSRDAHFLLGLLKSKVDFVCCDDPTTNKLTIQIKAVIAENERDAISARTSAALQALKARGAPWVSKKSGRLVERLGSPDPSKGSAAGVQAFRKRADEFAARMLPVIRDMQARGITELKAMAAELQRLKWKTARGSDEWTATAVRRILMRGA
jgi:DNA invertase Pin-like site-specific DNA recombinase